MFERSRFAKTKKEDKFKEHVLDLSRVTRVVAGGKRFRFRAVVVVGDLQGKVGIGVAKGLDVAASVEKAKRFAQKNLISVSIVNGTISHQIEAKLGSSKILIKPAKTGHGLVAGSASRIILRLAGVSNATAKFLSPSKNKLNNALVVIKALKELPQKSKLIN